MGSLLIDAAIPSLGHTIYAATIIGTVIALIAAVIGMIPSGKSPETTADTAVAAAVGGGEAGEVSPR
ncbi:hypothetical protein D3C74_371110 [compost metagenome]